MALADSARSEPPARPAPAEWIQRIHPAAALVAVVLLIMPADRQRLLAGPDLRPGRSSSASIALSLMFLAGYGGMVSLAQMTIAGFAGYMVAIFGVNGSASISLGLAVVAGDCRWRSSWRWLFGTVVGALAVRTEGIYTIMITLAIAAAFFYFTNQNYAIFNGHTGINAIPTPHFWGVDWQRADPLLLPDARRRGALLRRGRPISRARRSASPCRAMRDNPRRMAALGFNVNAHRVAAYVFAALRRGARRRPAGLELTADRAGNGQRLAGDRHSHHRRRRRHRASDRAVHRRADLCRSADLRARLPGQRRPRRQPLPAADRPRLPRHRVLFPGRRHRPLGRAGATG